MDWLGVALKLVSWHGISRSYRWGFILAILGNALLGRSAVDQGLLGIGVYCCIVTGIQLNGFLSWGKIDESS